MSLKAMRNVAGIRNPPRHIFGVRLVTLFFNTWVSAASTPTTQLDRDNWMRGGRGTPLRTIISIATIQALDRAKEKHDRHAR